MLAIFLKCFLVIIYQRVCLYKGFSTRVEKCARLTLARPGWRCVATFNAWAVIKCTALRLHLSGVSYCPHARKFIRLTDTLASSKRCTYSLGHILQCWGLMEHNLVWVGCNTILLFSSSHPFEVWTIYPIVFLLRMICRLTMLVSLIDTYSFVFLHSFS